MANAGATDRQHRAGRAVAQPAGYRAFVPAPLPPNLPIRMAGRLTALLSQADRALGRLDGLIRTLPDPDLFVLMHVRKEAVLSSQIEGTQSSLQIEGTQSSLRDVLAAEARFLPVAFLQAASHRILRTPASRSR